MHCKEESKITPMMAQWRLCKNQAKDALLLFRLGDFYEGFHEDASILSRELDLTLTKRGDVPMSGVPCHTIEMYIDRLVEKGFKVALAEQMEEAHASKGLVERQVTRIISPGTLTESSLLCDRKPNFIASICFLNATFGLSFLDLSTGDFRTLETENPLFLIDKLYLREPKELIISPRCYDALQENLDIFIKKRKILYSKKEEWHFDHAPCYEFLRRHFHVHSLDGFGLSRKPLAINAAGALLRYVNEDLHISISHIDSLSKEESGEFLEIDRTTQKHLELVESLHGEGTSLLEHLDETKTPMGSRLLREWLLHPLLHMEKIHKREEAVKAFLAHKEILLDLRTLLNHVRDIERLITRIAGRVASPRDLSSLRDSLEPVAHIRSLIEKLPSSLLAAVQQDLIDFSFLCEKIQKILVLPAPLKVSDGCVIQKGVDENLDALRDLQSSGHTWITEYQSKLREELGIRSLKVSYTAAFGYYIEVSHAQAEKMGPSFIRRQTLVNTERFISSELKEYEAKILSAESKISALEFDLFMQLKTEAVSYAAPIRKLAQALGIIDVLHSFALTAIQRAYTCPLVDESLMIEIQEGRHPIIEASLSKGAFIPNNCLLNQEKRLMLLTGPNMSGKSTFIRQIALIVIMAQMGAFVPASAAHIGLIDKVFSRIGSSDDLSRGHSTFMVEMSETSSILRSATCRSLVLLDEIGRGTSTYDGIAIAWATADYLLSTPGKLAKTLFATHYAELHALEEKIPGAINCQVAVKQSDLGVLFLHKIVPGYARQSFGIHVAKIAGFPSSALKKAEEVLASLEKKSSPKSLQISYRAKQLDFFSPPEEVDLSSIIDEMRALDLYTLTPLAAFEFLAKWKKKI